MYHYGIIISYKLSYIAETVQTGNRNRVAAEIIQIYVTLIVEGHDRPVGCRSSMHRLNGFPGNFFVLCAGVCGEETRSVWLKRKEYF